MSNRDAYVAVLTEESVIVVEDDDTPLAVTTEDQVVVVDSLGLGAPGRDGLMTQAQVLLRGLGC